MNHMTERSKKNTKTNRKTRQKFEGFSPRPEVTSLLRDYVSLKVTKYFTMPALFYAQSTELLAKSCILVLLIYANYAKFKVT